MNFATTRGGTAHNRQRSRGGACCRRVQPNVGSSLCRRDGCQLGLDQGTSSLDPALASLTRRCSASMSATTSVAPASLATFSGRRAPVQSRLAVASAASAVRPTNRCRQPWGWRGYHRDVALIFHMISISSADPLWPRVALAGVVWEVGVRGRVVADTPWDGVGDSRCRRPA